MIEWYHWAGFVATLFALLAFDLIRHDDSHVMPFREALRWSALWVVLAVVFGVVVWLWLGSHTAGEYAAGYLIEWSLSVDNVFVFILIFSHFSVRPEHQHRVLFWGVLGAVVTRLSFILGGSALLHRFDWVIYVFGALLVVTALRFLRERKKERSLDESVVLRLTRRFLPMTDRFDGPHLTARVDGRRLATPLFAVLVLIEATDVVFAVDSIPAVFAVTSDAFVAFTSNAMAILGLRSLYFVMAGAIDRFRYLKPALAAVLGFVGMKMLLSEVVQIPVWASLAVIVVIIGVAGVASAVAGSRAEARGTPGGGAA
jgi:tellurite resistance protein TerC